MNIHYNCIFCNSVLLFTQIQENLKLAHIQGGTAACTLRPGLEAANKQLETTVSTGLWSSVSVHTSRCGKYKVIWRCLIVSEKRMIYISFIRVNACKQTAILEQLTNGEFVIVLYACFHLDKTMTLSYEFWNDFKLVFEH